MNNNFMGGMYGNDPDMDFKKALISSISEKVSPKLIAEHKKLNQQNKQLNNYKNQFQSENQKLLNLIQSKDNIIQKCNDELNNIETEILKNREYVKEHQSQSMTADNCLNYVKVSDPVLLRTIAKEACLEESIQVMSKAYEKKSMSLEDAIEFVRNASKEIVAVRFLREKKMKEMGINDINNGMNNMAF